MPATLPVTSRSLIPPLPLTILFGTETGTAQMLAERAAEQAAAVGFVPQVLDMAEVDIARLAAQENLLVVVSTYGYGEPPGNAIDLHAALAAGDTNAVPVTLPATLKFSVCALGDERYAEFCQCGRDFDAFLEKRGATRIAPRADCTLDYDDTFDTWLATALDALKAATPATAITGTQQVPVIAG